MLYINICFVLLRNIICFVCFILLRNYFFPTLVICQSVLVSVFAPKCSIDLGVGKLQLTLMLKWFFGINTPHKIFLSV